MEENNDSNDLASFEGKYPRDLFNKTVLLNDLPFGRVLKEADDYVVISNDSDASTRFDIPKSEITIVGSSVIVNDDLLTRYRKQSDEPMPPDRPLRPSGEEIRSAAAEQLETTKEKKTTTPDAVMEEGIQLSSTPRIETRTVSMPEGYVDTESELSKKIKGALTELKEIIIAGTKVAKKKAKEMQLQAAQKQAEMDAETISRMGDLSSKFANSFEDILSDIRTRTYADQAQIYTGFLKLMDTQRELVIARRDLAKRLQDSVAIPVVQEPPKLEDVSALPKDINEREQLESKTEETKS